jgi:hypothetical protein
VVEKCEMGRTVEKGVQGGRKGKLAYYEGCAADEHFPDLQVGSKRGRVEFGCIGALEGRAS